MLCDINNVCVCVYKYPYHCCGKIANMVKISQQKGILRRKKNRKKRKE